MSPVRIAICISGMVRSNFETIPSINKFIEYLESNGVDVDVFLHTWDKREVYSPGGVNILERKIPLDILNHIEKKYLNPEIFAKAFPKSFKTLENPVYKKLTKSKIKEILNLRLYEIEDQSDFHASLSDDSQKNLRYRQTLNQANMFYSIAKSMNLAKQYSDENTLSYDVVLRTRPDSFIENFNIEDFLKEGAQNQVHTMNLVKEYCGDIFFFSNQKIMFSLIKLWEKISYSQSTMIFEDQIPRFAEPLLTKWFVSKQVNIRKCSSIHATLPVRFVNKVGMVHPDLLFTLKKEAEEKGLWVD